MYLLIMAIRPDALPTDAAALTETRAKLFLRFDAFWL
jgi:hypothetical protein